MTDATIKPTGQQVATLGVGAAVTKQAPSERQRRRVYLARSRDPKGRIRFHARWWEQQAGGLWKFASEHILTTEPDPPKPSLRKWEREAREHCWRLQDRRMREADKPRYPEDLYEHQQQYLRVYEGRITPSTLIARQRILDDVGSAAAVWTQEGIEAYLERRRQDGLKPSTLKLELKIIRGFARWATLRGLLYVDPTVDLEITVPPQVRPTILEDSAVAGLIWESKPPHLQDYQHTPANSVEYQAPLRAGIALLALAGLRRGELNTLWSQDYDREAGVLRVGMHLDVTRTKVHRRALPLGPVLAGILDAVPFAGQSTRREPLLVGAYGSALTSQANRWVKRAGITPHDLRRWFYTAMERIGCPSSMLGDLVGHAPRGARGHYSGLRLSEAKEYMEAVERLVPRPYVGG